MPKPTIKLKSHRGNPVLLLASAGLEEQSRESRVERAMLLHLTQGSPGVFEDKLEAVRYLALAHGWNVTVDGK